MRYELNIRDTRWWQRYEQDPTLDFPTLEKLREFLEAGGIEVITFSSLGMAGYVLISPDDPSSVWPLYTGIEEYRNPDYAILNQYLSSSQTSPEGQAIQALIRLVVPRNAE